MVQTVEEKLASIEAHMEALPRIEKRLETLCDYCPKYRERVDTNRKLLIVTWMVVAAKWVHTILGGNF